MLRGSSQARPDRILRAWPKGLRLCGRSPTRLAVRPFQDHDARPVQTRAAHPSLATCSDGDRLPWSRVERIFPAEGAARTGRAAGTHRGLPAAAARFGLLGLAPRQRICSGLVPGGIAVRGDVDLQALVVLRPARRGGGQHGLVGAVAT